MGFRGAVRPHTNQSTKAWRHIGPHDWAHSMMPPARNRTYVAQGRGPVAPWEPPQLKGPVQRWCAQGGVGAQVHRRKRRRAHHKTPHLRCDWLGLGFRLRRALLNDNVIVRDPVPSPTGLHHPAVNGKGEGEVVLGVHGAGPLVWQGPTKSGTTFPKVGPLHLGHKLGTYLSSRTLHQRTEGR